MTTRSLSLEYMIRTTIAALGLLAIFSAASCLAQARTPEPTLRYGNMPNQLTVSILRSNSGYALDTGSAVKDSNLSGYGIDWVSRRIFPFDIVGSYRYSTGSLFHQQLQTATAGFGYSRPFSRFVPVVQASLGFARTSSRDNMYLYSGPRTGFTTLLGAGIDVPISQRWGVRPIYTEFQYLPFGEARSRYWNVSAGVFYRFRLRNGLPRF